MTQLVIYCVGPGKIRVQSVPLGAGPVGAVLVPETLALLSPGESHECSANEREVSLFIEGEATGSYATN